MNSITIRPWFAAAICRLDMNCINNVKRPPASIIGQRLAIHAGNHPVDGWTAKDEIFRDKIYSQFLPHEDPEEPWHAETIDNLLDHMSTSAIVAVVTVAGWWEVWPKECEQPDGSWLDLDVYRTGLNKPALYPGNLPGMTPAPACSRWWARKAGDGRPQFGWHLTDIVALDTPIPAKGKQGLWTVDDDVAAKLRGM